MFKISTSHLLLLALLYITALCQDESPEVVGTEEPSMEDTVAMDIMEDTMAMDIAADEDDASFEDMTTGLPVGMDDDGEPGADVADDGDDEESFEDTMATEEPAMDMELTEVADDMEDESDEDMTTPEPEMGGDVIAEVGEAPEVEDGVASDRQNDMGAITGKSGKDATNPGTLNGVWAAIGSVIGLLAILVGCGLVYSYRKGKWDGTQAAMKKVVALQMSEVTEVEPEDEKLNEEDSVHQDDLISSDDGKDDGEKADFLENTYKTDAIIIIE